MIDNMGMYQGYSIEGSTKVDVQNESSECKIPSEEMMCTPIYECPQERCIHKQIIHEVPHVQPINTRIINHHIYRHTYTPCYTCTVENEVCNVNACGPKII